MPNDTPTEAIKDRLNLLDLVSSHTPLRKAGRGYKGLCPFHTEKTPSFYVFPENNTYHCFGCSAHGDVFSFTMRTLNMDFPTALRTLAERAGVSLGERGERSDRGEIQRLRQVTEAAVEYFHQVLLQSRRQALSYLLQDRGLTLETIEGFHLGAALQARDALGRYLIERGFTTEEGISAGLLIRKTETEWYDRFRNRIIFPIRDERGRTIGFGGRALDESEPKYLNSPQTPLFDKGSNLYGIDHAHSAIRQRGEAVLVEGYFDVLMAHQAGFPNVVGSLGTSLTERQMTRLTRLCRRIILAMDADTAGQHAVERGLEVGRATAEGTSEPTFVWQGLPHFELRRRINADLRILVLPAGRDPDEVIRSSPEQWTDLTQNAKGFIEHYFELAAARFNPRAPEQQQAIVAFLAPVIDQLADPFQRSYYLQRLARWLRVDERLILRETQQGSRMTKQKLGNVLPTRSRQSLDEYYVGLLLTHPEWLTSADLAAADDLEHPQGRELVRLLTTLMQQSDRFEIDQFRQTLDPILQEFVEHLMERAAEQPPLNESTFRAATRQSILKLRERRCRSLLQENHFLLDDAERAGDEGEVTRLKDLARRLGQELGQIFKLQTSVAMGARSH